MKALTVRQPWAHLIAEGVKRVENRIQGTDYRGPLAIHVARTWSHEGAEDFNVRREMGGLASRALVPDDVPQQWGQVIAVVDLVDCHVSDGYCCGAWGWWHEPNPPRLPARTYRHLVLENARRLAVPFDATGRLGLWDIDTALIDAGGDASP